ncbi:acyl-homoserine-lactone synthase [Synchytrium microbalum]|uniref:Acyl-homoserine-lactone synthase n=1 Tax=Synchytrium microbalum TaxID=1806994 RepID=A0A507C0T1_9FUNG|nr:acyl-homoserine-lactone synthase [Synchytrium microbalum]TPX31576.1 acyl-homoserine-lactone synthase [Synchytrium microbalum]
MEEPPNLDCAKGLPIQTNQPLYTFEKDGFTFREITTQEELKEAFALRYRIICERLHWVEGDVLRGLEYDEFDPYSYHFGCYSNHYLVGYLRFTRETAPCGIMTRKYFTELIQRDPKFTPEEVVDLSRILVDMEAINRKKPLIHKILGGLFRLTFLRTRNLHSPAPVYGYLVTNPLMLKGLRWTFGCKVREMGHAKTSDGKITYSAYMSLPGSLFYRAKMALASSREIKKQYSTESLFDDNSRSKLERQKSTPDKILTKQHSIPTNILDTRPYSPDPTTASSSQPPSPYPSPLNKYNSFAGSRANSVHSVASSFDSSTEMSSESPPTDNNAFGSIQMMPKVEAPGEYAITLFLDRRISYEFKFIVDGIWRCSTEFPTVSDNQGNVNNVLAESTSPTSPNKRRTSSVPRELAAQ